MRFKLLFIFASFALLSRLKAEQIQISIHGASGPEDPVELGKPFTVNCKLNSGFDSSRSQKLSIFLNCPFRPEGDDNISCFQGCSQLCMEDTKCKNYDILQSTKCQYVHDSNEGLTYSYRFPEFTKALIDQRQFSCKFEGTLSNIISVPFNPRLHKSGKQTASITPTSTPPPTTSSTTTTTALPETTQITLPSTTLGPNTLSTGLGEGLSLGYES
ncbi:hypothetical protein Ciccas_008462 [Cichlidogyrus casuarinus]|uniref:Uncharacterized protein n=1 Tax=Cichlidogyrus casuarinus TaxID=1844966 RepID=A0ABD2PZV1_9PLAT